MFKMKENLWSSIFYKPYVLCIEKSHLTCKHTLQHSSKAALETVWDPQVESSGMCSSSNARTWCAGGGTKLSYLSHVKMTQIIRWTGFNLCSCDWTTADAAEYKHVWRGNHTNLLSDSDVPHCLIAGNANVVITLAARASSASEVFDILVLYKLDYYYYYCHCCFLAWSACIRRDKHGGDKAVTGENWSGAEEENYRVACSLRYSMEPIMHSSIPTPA